MILLITILCIIGLIIIYFKFKHDEKKKADCKREVEPSDRVDLNDFPTYTRNKVKNP